MTARERGSATLLVLCTAGLLMTVTAGLLAVAGALVARQRAESAADLAALAGARSSQPGDGGGAAAADPGCTAAQRVATAARATVVACVAAGSPGRPVVTVVVEVPVPRLLAVLDVPPARARARAGVPP